MARLRFNHGDSFIRGGCFDAMSIPMDDYDDGLTADDVIEDDVLSRP
jgi:hypothetical protein